MAEPVSQEQNKVNTARLFGVSVREVDRWLADGCPAKGRGVKGRPIVMHVPSVIQWYVTRTLDKATGSLKAQIADLLGVDDGEVLSQAEETLRLTKAQADLKATQAAQLAGELIPMDDVVQALRATMVLIRSTMEGRSGRHAGELANMTNPAEIRAMLLDDDRQTLNAATDRLQDVVGDCQGQQVDGAATDSGTVAVG